jgi:hypothetical protein
VGIIVGTGVGFVGTEVVGTTVGDNVGSVQNSQELIPGTKSIELLDFIE